MSTIFLTAPNTHDNIANIVMKSSWEAVKTLQLNSHETSSSSGLVQMQVFLPLFMRFLLMISGTRSVMGKRENMETERK